MKVYCAMKCRKSSLAFIFLKEKKAKVEDNPWKRKKGKKKVWKMSTITRVGAYLKRI